MANWKRLILFVLLNIVISAITVFIVLVVWQQTHPTAQVPTPIIFEPAGEPQLSNQEPTLTPEEVKITADGMLTLDGVFGVGAYNMEYILIRNNSEASLNLLGWQVSTPQGNIYDFPALTLNQGGAVKLFSKSGSNSVIELFWNADDALWSPGDQVNLIDPSGNLHVSYQIQ